MSEHTPGPWTVTAKNWEPVVRTADDKNGKPVASCWLNGDDVFANAHLIAAAPDMLAALMAAVKLSDERLPESISGVREDRCQVVYDQCADAIAKATGRPFASA